jgi:hypothetical protein
MTTKEIKEKYGIEPIMKEMWVWDKFEKAKLRLVLYKNLEKNDGYPYKCMLGMFENASENNMNEPKEPQVGDKGYFWDDEDGYVFCELTNICQDGRPPYYAIIGIWFYNFSHEKQPWMK